MFFIITNPIFLATRECQEWEISHGYGFISILIVVCYIHNMYHYSTSCLSVQVTSVDPGIYGSVPLLSVLLWWHCRSDLALLSII